ncbi:MULTISPECIES: hypothetical protein [unclassified Streptomyces]|uniref:hypothetical protein n=1 Tax=unclassified Streptomyces TaxID=2593676 RepID=UPI0038143C69
MYPESHLLLHRLRTAELEAAAARPSLPRERRLRTRLGWILVELGLRLTQQPPRRAARLV